MNLLWEIDTAVDPALLTLMQTAADCALHMEGVRRRCAVSVRLCDDETIHELNREFRGIDRATDVLSFPLGENGEYDVNPATGAKLLGDVVLSMEKAVAQAEEYEHSFEREVCYLTVHSMLHLLGYDHMNNEEKAVMRMKEETVMSRIGLGLNK